MKLPIGSCLSAVAFATLFPIAAQAQAAADAAPADGSLAEIVVTAEKREGNVQKTAIAIDVVTNAQLTQNGVNDIQSLQNIAPGVQFGQAGTSTFVTVRGVSGRDSTEIGDPAVAINMDGIFLQRPSGMNAAFFDLDRIEVLSGPQGTLYGRNATGGVINIISKRPTFDDVGGYAALTLGNYKTINGEGAINLPLGETLAARASFISRNHDGYRNNASAAFPTNGKLRGDDEETVGARLQFLFKPNSSFSALVSGTYIKQGGVGPAMAGYPTTRPEAPSDSALAKNYALNTVGDFNTTRKNLLVQLDYDFGPAKATYLFGYAGLDIDHIFDNDGTDTRFYEFKRGEYSEDLSHEFRLASNGEGAFQWQVGGFLYDQDLAVRSLNYVDRVSPYILRDFQFDVDVKSRAAFAHASYALTDELKFSAGVRYSKDTKVRTGFRLAGPGLGNADLNLTAQPTLVRTDENPALSRSTDKDWSYHVGLDYQVSPSSLLYAKVDKGYKSGGFTSINAYGPERVISYEIGSKNRFLDNSLQLNLSAFRYDYTDQQVGQITPQGAQTLNAGKSRVYGIETQLDWKVTPSDTLDLSVNWLDAKFKDFAINVSGVNVQQAGHRLIQAPEWSISAGYEHSFELANGGRVTPRVQGIYRSEYYFTVFNRVNDRQGSYAMLDLSLGYTAPNDKWSLQLYARNLTDKVALTSAAIGGFTGTNIYQYAAPRTFGARVQVNF